MDTPYAPSIVIEAGHAERHYWLDVWRYRELFYYLAWRDVIVRYKQTAIGPVWTVVRPILTMAVFTLVFGKLARVPTAGAPYPLFFFAAMLPWQFFSFSLSTSAESLVGNTNLVSKVYFPRILVPVSSLGVNCIDLAVTFVLLLVMLLLFRYPLSIHILVLPAFLLEMVALSIGLGLWFSALTVIYRDFRFIVGFVVQFGFFLSPVGYGSAMVRQYPWWPLYYANPMAGIIEGFRWALLARGSTLDFTGQVVSLAVVVLFLFCGYRYFRTVERRLADYI